MTNDDLNVYIVNFQASEAPGFANGQLSLVHIEGFNLYLRNSQEIAAYWNYIPLLYMVKTKLPARELAIRFRPFLGSRFVVGRIDKQDVDGLLPSAAWDWIYFPHQEKWKPAGGMLPPPGL
ncbi:hypothetical protein [Mesorhizobium sp. M0030]|uniref:hypothetical protein n=1 Tax=Mesorhizobium sp. M0030 TaxID=2956851 RepID=UPI00333DD8E3